jgi:hypothetical protein
MLDFKMDQIKSQAVIRKEMGKTCTIPGCGKPLTHMQGPGSGVLCRDHQVDQREYGGLGRLDRKHTFHRQWECVACGWNVLEDPRIADVEDEDIKRSIARGFMHGDHNGLTRAEGGDDSAENIKSLCFVCHSKKTILNKDHLRNRNKIAAPKARSTAQ